MDLQTPIVKAGRWYQRNARGLEKLGIYRLSDLLFHIPFRYEDFSLISKIGQVQPGEIVTIEGTATEIKNNYARNGLKIQKATIADGTGTIDVTWFNQPYLTRVIKKGDTVSLSGKVDYFGKAPQMQSPEYEIITGQNERLHTGRLVPIYPETKGITSKWLRRQIYVLLSLEQTQTLEYLSEEIRSRNNLMNLYTSLQTIHFPKKLEQTKGAKERLAFDEVFLLQLKALKRRREWKEQLEGSPFQVEKHKENIEKFVKSLPFTLTDAQQKAIAAIFEDLADAKPMNRLLEGDVGSGKTIVAAIAMYLAHLNKKQSVLMAPTEILAQQHHATISNLLSPFGVKVELVTGSKKLKIENLKLKIDILIGTHAVLSEKINFDNLGFVVIDEQQRFGVLQRGLIRKKGKNPHLLTMTATPIPRTVALTLYGDLDLSLLDEMPKGRRIIKTWLVPKVKREAAYKWIEKQLKETQSQAFILCPFIEESESMQTVKAATKEYDRLKKDVFPNLRLGLLHGKMKTKEKDNILENFRKGLFDILVCTPVVEVGIDIPNATIMVIEAAERFGLAQLHQLRGRVGRAQLQSYCLLFTESENELTKKRLKALESYHVGPELAELDLAFRGSGDLYGTMQHGQNTLKIASFSDTWLIEKAREEAKLVLRELDKHEGVVKKLTEIADTDVSPD